MTAVARGATAIFERDARIFWSYRARPVRELIGTLFTVALFYQLAQLVTTAEFPTSAAYFEYAAVGLAVMPMLRSGLLAPVTALREELVAGTFERLALSPLGASSSLVATLVFPFALAIVTGCAILLLSGAFFGLRLDWPSALLALPLSALTALALAPLGVLMLAGGVLAKQTNAGGGWIVAGLSLVGGVYFPPALLPAWIEWAAYVQPLTPALDLLRAVLTGAPLDAPAVLLVGVLVAFAAVGLPVATVALRAACARARRRGTLLDY